MSKSFRDSSHGGSRPGRFIRGGPAGRHPADSEAQRSRPTPRNQKETLSDKINNLLFGPPDRRPSDSTGEAPGRRAGRGPAGSKGPGKQSYWWGIKDNGKDK